MPQTCDYSDTDYKANFWENVDRVYEDMCERMALQKLMPERGRAILDIGAGFGRLTNEYIDRFDDVVLFDYAKNLLIQAEQEWVLKQNKSYVRCVQGDARRLPFSDQAFDVIVSVRMLHHILEVEQVFAEIHRVLRPGGCAVLEFANKRNAKELLRSLLRRTNAHPFSWEPYRRGDGVFYNFHPDFMVDNLKRVGLKVERCLSVSNFRLGFAKKFLDIERLLDWEDRLQESLGKWTFGPSVFVKVTRAPQSAALPRADCIPERSNEKFGREFA